MRSAIAPELRFEKTIRSLATGSKLADLHHQFRVHKSTIFKFFPKVCKALYETLKDKYMNVGKYISLMK